MPIIITGFEYLSQIKKHFLFHGNKSTGFCKALQCVKASLCKENCASFPFVLNTKPKQI